MNLFCFFTDFNNISKHKQLFYLTRTYIAIIIKNLKQFHFLAIFGSRPWTIVHGLKPKIENLVHVTKSLEFFYEVSYIGPC